MSTPTPQAAMQRETRSRSPRAGLVTAGVVAASAALVVVLAAASGWFGTKAVFADNPRLQLRVTAMQERLAAQAKPFVIIAGDSHAELLKWDRVCGLPVVNLGVDGAAAVDYARVLKVLDPDLRAEAAILFLGTNDLAHRHKPETDAGLMRFEQRFGGVTADLKRFAGRVAYVPVLPSGGNPGLSELIATERAGRFRTVAEKVCLAGGCLPLDVDSVRLTFAEDGLNLDRHDRAEGAALHRLVEDEICPADRMSGPGSAFPSIQKKGLPP